MYRSTLHGNREVPEATILNPRMVRSAKAIGRTADMHAPGKSDTGIVSQRRTNNGAHPQEGRSHAHERPPTGGV